MTNKMNSHSKFQGLTTTQLVVYMSGNAIEWYDFMIFASLSPILSSVFFPTDNKLLGIALAFSVFAVSFLARPLGGILLGYAADRFGCRKVFLITLMLTLLSCLCIASLPSYHTLGIIAPSLLLGLRLLQGFAIGGEYPLLITYIAGNSPPEKRGYFCSYANVTTLLGVCLGSLVCLGLNCVLSEKQLQNWGWRLPFIISWFFLAIAGYFRSQFFTSDLIQNVKKRQIQTKIHVSQWIRLNFHLLVKIFFFIIGGGVAYYTQNVFISYYLQHCVGMSANCALWISLFGSLILIFCIPMAGKMSDKFGRKSVLMCSLMCVVGFSYPLYTLLGSLSIASALIAQISFAVMLSCYLGVFPAFIYEQVDNQLPCTTLATAYNLAMAVGGGTAPLVNLFLMKILHNLSAPGIYMAFSAAISLSALLLMSESHRESDILHDYS